MTTDSIWKRRKSNAIVHVLVLAAIALACLVLWRLDTEPRTDDSFAYADTINVTPEVSGLIIDLAVSDNQAVKQGQVLFRIDPRPYNEALNRAQANLDALDSEIALTQRSVNAQKLGAIASTTSVERNRAALSQATDTLNRMEPLLAKGYVSAEQIDQGRTAKRVAQVQLDTSLIDAQRATAAISGVDALVAKRAVAKADIELAKINLEHTSVRAPFDGRIIALRTSVGQFAAAGHPIFTLANTGRWYVVANFRETELAHIMPGHVAQVYLLSDPSRRFSGVVDSIGYGVFPDDGGSEAAGLPRIPRSINWVRVAQRFPVRILIDKPDPALFRIGASTVAIINSSTRTVTP